MPLGPVLIGLQGLELDATEREMLCHPAAGGVVLFSRNYRDPEQLAALTRSIRALRTPQLLIAVDHEGGRVQRFRKSFTLLPSARRQGQVYQDNPAAGLELARATGWLMAAELRATGVDFSFAPVLDLDYGQSDVIGDRSFHRDPQIVAELAAACMRGMRAAGMVAVGKHFPGHGSVAADSHLELPVDRRRYADLLTEDLLPFERLIHYGIAAIMPAHILYPQVDEAPASFSHRWLQDILRGRLGFQGPIISDDLDMGGATRAGGPVERARQALDAGCDIVLTCNDPKAAAAILEHLQPPVDPGAQSRRSRLHGRGGHYGLAALQTDPAWRQYRQRLAEDADRSSNARRT